jgi:hypothetical protein
MEIIATGVPAVSENIAFLDWNWWLADASKQRKFDDQLRRLMVRRALLPAVCEELIQRAPIRV